MPTRIIAGRPVTIGHRITNPARAAVAAKEDRR